MENIILNCSCVFSNGVTVVNCTPHPLSFLSPEGDKVIVPCSVPSGEKSGPLVISARAVEEEVAPHLVRTAFLPSEDGQAIIDAINEALPGAFIVGSMIAMNAYPGKVCGMVPAPGFERVPPAEKLMSTEKFNTAG